MTVQTRTKRDLLRVLMQADDAGYRLEYVGGLGTWEAHPLLIHQNAVDRIRQSIRYTGQDSGECGCVHKADIYIRFPEGSFKRPDIAIFCEEPTQLTEAVTLVPEAVIEIISRGSESKDLDVGVPFYISQGVKDVLVYDPYDETVLHHSSGRQRRLKSRVRLNLMCGCECEV